MRHRKYLPGLKDYFWGVKICLLFSPFPGQVTGVLADERVDLYILSNMAQIMTAQSVTRLGKNEIQAQLARCPSLPSLGSINKALQGVLLTEQRYTAQIAEIIRRDPSLTS